jgi:acetylornithine deacetylase/succinyl-diaminopimelate desuccinylase-like protein
MQPDLNDLNRALDWRNLPELAQRALDHALNIQRIPAPTFSEEPRARFVATCFEAAGLQQVELDDFHNVYGRIPGLHPSRSGVLISAHTDTVFSADTDLTIRREGTLIYGPGLGDNSMGVGGLLALAEYLRDQHLQPECDLWFVANTREEGLGDLGGMKAAFTRLKTRISRVINLEGMAFGHVYHAGIAVRRLHITAATGGGHSWLNFGRPSAIHGIMQLGAQITTLKTSNSPRTTYNIGLIEGGQSINTIAASAGLWLDLRAESSAALAGLETEVRKKVTALSKPDLSFQIEVVGDRPAGSIAPEHPLVQRSLTALKAIGYRGTLENGSTDANIPLSQGCAAVTIGITRGSNAHRLDEYIETTPVMDGLRQLILVTLATSAIDE